jgi:hypothetical protein
MGATAQRRKAAQAPIGRSRAKFFLGNMGVAPVWNFLGETEAFFLTFYAKK